jgi:hypothetical protein
VRNQPGDFGLRLRRRLRDWRNELSFVLKDGRIACLAGRDIRSVHGERLPSELAIQWISRFGILQPRPQTRQPAARVVQAVASFGVTGAYGLLRVEHRLELDACRLRQSL